MPMTAVVEIHRILGEMVLPLLIVIAAIWLTVTWKPGAPASPIARLFPVLVDIQAMLGLIYFVFLIIGGNMAVLSFPFILHPLLGLVAVGFGHWALQENGPFRGMGRWAPLAALAVLLVLVIASVVLAMN
jgi:hypothetical protein